VRVFGFVLCLRLWKELRKARNQNPQTQILRVNVDPAPFAHGTKDAAPQFKTQVKIMTNQPQDELPERDAFRVG